MTSTIKLRRDTAALWAFYNPTLALGEPAYETDTGQIKIGDGSTAYNSLAYLSVTAAAGSLTGTTLASNVVNSSLTSVGTLTNLTVTNPISGSVTGNAATATALQNSRTINGVSFNGTSNITVTAAAGTLTGTTLNSSVIFSSLTSLGNITSGTWSGDRIGLAFGGTNADLSATGGASQVLRQSSSGAAITVSQLAYADISGLGTMAQQNSGSVSITGGSITGMSSPVGSSDVATKGYVDALTTGLENKTPVAAATTANLTATYNNGSSGVGATLTNSGSQAAFAVDGYSASSGDRILVKNQSTTSQNGIYIVTTVGNGSTNWVLTRATDFNSSSNISEGDYTIVETGTTNIGTMWIETGVGPFTLGTTAITFTELAVAPQTITFTGDATGTGAGTIALTLATVNSNTGSFGSSTAIPSFTVNAKGLITAASTNAVIAPAGTLTGTTLASNVVTSSLTTVGTIGTGTWQGTKVGLAYGGTNADLSATGGTSQVLRQSSSGAAITVSQLSVSDVSGAAASGANTDITSVLLNQTGLVVKGATTNALTIKPNETLSAARTLNIVTGDATRTLTFSGDATISGTNTGDQTSVTGNAGTATALQTARNINGVSFNGTADITVTAAAGTLTGTTLASNVVTSSLTTVGTIGTGTWSSSLDAETFSVAATVTAGTNAQGQGALTKDYNVVTTTSNNPSGVTLPTGTTGRRLTVVNKGTNPINVYPASGAAIDALSANTSIQIPVGGRMMFDASSTTQWYSTANDTFAAPVLGTPASGNLSNCTSYSANSLAGTTLASSVVTSSLTTVGTIGTGTWQGTAVDATHGGTNQTTWTTGDLLYASGSNTLSKLAVGATNKILTVNGGAPSWQYPFIPQNSQSAAYTTTITDSGGHILHPSSDTTARTFTIDSNANVAYPIGTAITFVNQNGAGTVTIAITSDTMRLAGTGTTGNRTLAANGMATALKIATTEWIISGTGLT